MLSADYCDQKQDWYQDNIDMILIQPTMTLLSMAQAQNSDKILECGCGTGLAARLFASTFLKPGQTYVATNFSDKMLETAWSKIQESDFRSGKNTLIQEFDSITPFSEVELKSDKRNFVSGQASLTELPFEENTFDTVYMNNVLSFLQEK